MAKIKINSFEGFKIYTDGSCDNIMTKIGGYSYLIIDGKGEEYARFAGSDVKTTNNRMELKAIVEAIKVIPQDSTVTIFTDSKYCITVLDHKTKTYEKNFDIIQEFRYYVSKLKLRYRFAWVKGHNGHEQNEIVDKMANEACAERGGHDIDYKRLQIDKEYKIREMFKAKIYSLIEDVVFDYVPLANQQTLIEEISREIDNRFPTLPKEIK